MAKYGFSGKINDI